MVGGAVTVIAPQPEFTVGAEGAGGNITTFTMLLAEQPPGAVEPAAFVPQAAVNT